MNYKTIKKKEKLNIICDKDLLKEVYTEIIDKLVDEIVITSTMYDLLLPIIEKTNLVQLIKKEIF